MKRKKNLMILGGILVVLCVIIGIVYGTKKHIDKVQTADEEIINTDPDKISKISWQFQGETLNFEKKDGTWYNTEDESFPVDQDSIETLLSHFETVNASFVIEDVEDYDQYGLQSPECTITLSTGKESTDDSKAATTETASTTTAATTEDASDTTATTAEAEASDDTEAEAADSTEATLADGDITIQLGNYSTMDSKRYLTLGEGTVYLIDDDLEQYVSSDRDTYLDKDTIPSYDLIKSFEVDSDETVKASYLPDEKHSYTQDYDFYAINGDSYKAISEDKVTSFIDSIKNLDTSSYVTYNATEDDLSKYGFDDPDLTFTFEYVPSSDDTDASGDTSTKADSTDDSETKNYKVSFASTSKKKCYMHVDGSSVIFNVDQESYDSIVATDYNTLRPSKVITLDWDKVESIDFTLDGDTYTITKKGDKFKLDGEEVDFTSVESAIDALEVDEFKDEKDVKAEELAFTVHYDDSDYSELSVDLYKFDGDNCVAKFNNETLGYVSRDLVNTLTEAVNKVVLG